MRHWHALTVTALPAGSPNAKRSLDIWSFKYTINGVDVLLLNHILQIMIWSRSEFRMVTQIRTKINLLLMSNSLACHDVFRATWMKSRKWNGKAGAGGHLCRICRIEARPISCSQTLSPNFSWIVSFGRTSEWLLKPWLPTPPAPKACTDMPEWWCVYVMNAAAGKPSSTSFNPWIHEQETGLLFNLWRSLSVHQF